jgi:hypothetical protein
MFQTNEGYDTVLVAPSPKALTDALARATKAANLRCRNALAQVGPEEVEKFARKVARTPEGFRQWLGPEEAPRRDDHRSAVAAAWWTDRLGRKHVRLKGARWSFNYGDQRVTNSLCPYRQKRPPLWMIYPDHVYVADAGAGRLVLAACGCGEAGTAEELGWMGDCCSACHDRREEGQATPRMARLPTPPSRSSTSLGNPTAFSADGQRLARSTCDGVVLVHDLEGGASSQWPLTRSERNLIDQSDLAFLPNGHTLVLTAKENVVLLDSRTGERQQSFAAGGYLHRLTASPDGRLVAINSSSDRLAVFDLRSDKRLFGVAHGSEGPGVQCAAFTTDSRRLSVGCGDGTVRVWDVAGRREVARWDGPAGRSGGVAELAVSPDGRFVAALTNDLKDNLTLRDAHSGSARATWTLGRQGYHPRYWLRLIAFSHDSRTLAASEKDGVVKFYDVAGGPPVSLASEPEEVMGLAFCPAGRWLATTGGGDRIKLWPWEALLAAARRQGDRPAPAGLSGRRP